MSRIIAIRYNVYTDHHDRPISVNSKEVNRNIEEGWQPYGPPVPFGKDNAKLLQTLVKYAEPLAEVRLEADSMKSRTVCDLCGRPASSRHIDPVSGMPRHPHCTPF